MLPRLFLVEACIDCTCGLHDEDVLGQLAPLALKHGRKRGHRVFVQRRVVTFASGAPVQTRGRDGMPGAPLHQANARLETVEGPEVS